MNREPLANRMRPITLDEIVGQENVIGKGTVLRKRIETDNLLSIIFWGSPGTGKTTIAEVIAKTTKYKYYKLNAVTAGVSDIKEIIQETENPLYCPKGSSILFVDEIHRFNKAQQDVLLPYVENGTIILIGATTENPYYVLNHALLSRVMTVKLNDITESDILKLLKRTMQDKHRGLGDLEIDISDEVLEYIAEKAFGDIRYSLRNIGK